MLAACQSGKGGATSAVADNTQATDTVADTASLNTEVRLRYEQGVVLNRVKDILDMVKADYMRNGGFLAYDLYDKVFCSKSWNKLVMDVRRKEHNTGTLFFDVDSWTMTYEPGVFNFDEFEVTTLVLEPQMRASVSFTVYEAYTYRPARIDLVYEDGRWVIDNFHDMKYMTNVRNCMWNYLHTNYI